MIDVICLLECTCTTAGSMCYSIIFILKEVTVSQFFCKERSGSVDCVQGDHGMEGVIHKYSESQSDSIGLCCSVLD